MDINAAPATYTIIIQRIGELHICRSVADIFEPGVLTVTSIDNGAVLRQLPPDQWQHATVYGANGYPIYGYHAGSAVRA